METVLAAAVLSIAPTLAVILTWKQQKKQVAEIHTLVNSRLTEALEKITRLENQLIQEQK